MKIIYLILTASVSRGDRTILYGHYPTSTIISDCKLQDLFARSSAYVCGHLHNIHGFVESNSIWHHHDSGLLELELADWKNNHK